MAYVYLSDGGPEAEDYDSNYYYFDASNPEAIAAIEKMLSSNAARDWAFRSEFERICRSSFARPTTARTKKGRRSWVASMISFLNLRLETARMPRMCNNVFPGLTIM